MRWEITLLSKIKESQREARVQACSCYMDILNPYIFVLDLDALDNPSELILLERVNMETLSPSNEHDSFARFTKLLCT